MPNLIERIEKLEQQINEIQLHQPRYITYEDIEKYNNAIKKETERLCIDCKYHDASNSIMAFNRLQSRCTYKKTYTIHDKVHGERIYNDPDDAGCEDERTGYGVHPCGREGKYFERRTN
jgi:hypothetical protein